MPLMPLFSPIYSSTRSYSQTRSNTQRDLMLPDEILRLDRRQCIALFQGRKPALLYKLTPEELPDYSTLKSCRVIDYIPEWKQRELEKEQKSAPKQEPPSEPPRKETPAAIPPEDTAPPPPLKTSQTEDVSYDIPDMKEPMTGGLGMVEITAVRDSDDEDEDSPPGR